MTKGMKAGAISRKKNRRTYPASDVDRYFVEALRAMLRLPPLYAPEYGYPPDPRQKRETGRARHLGSKAEMDELRRFYVTHEGDGNRQVTAHHQVDV